MLQGPGGDWDSFADCILDLFRMHSFLPFFLQVYSCVSEAGRGGKVGGHSFVCPGLEMDERWM